MEQEQTLLQTPLGYSKLLDPRLCQGTHQSPHHYRTHRVCHGGTPGGTLGLTEAYIVIVEKLSACSVELRKSTASSVFAFAQVKMVVNKPLLEVVHKCAYTCDRVNPH